MKGIFYISFFFLLFYLPETKAQNNSTAFVISGTIIDGGSNKPISFCHIYNESRRRGFISDSSGKFSTYTKTGDTLVFIALGYLGKTYIVQENDRLPFIIKLIPRTYYIEAVTIGIPRNYSELKEAIMELDVDKEKPRPELPEYNPYIRPQLLDTNIIYNPGFMIMHPVSGLYYRFSKVEKSKRQVRYLQEQELKQPVVDAKYSRELVSKLTGFTGDDLNNFIGYCHFSFNYLYDATPLEIVETIHKKHDEYIQCCYGQTENQNP